MNICSCENVERNTDLKNLNYDEIFLKINRNKLKFCENDNYGVYRLVEGDLKENEKDEEAQKLNIEINNLKHEINECDITIKDYTKKILEMEKKIEKMKKILEIDVCEQDYISELKDTGKLRYEIKSVNEKSQN